MTDVVDEPQARPRISAEEAFKRLSASLGEYQAQRVLLRWAKEGRLRAVAESFKRIVEGPSMDKELPAPSSSNIPDRFWTPPFGGEFHVDWSRSRFSRTFKFGRVRVVIEETSGVSFDLGDLLKCTGEDGFELAPKAQQKKSGRTPSHWWSALAVELAVLIHEGGRPTTQTALTQALLDRLEDRGYEVSKRTVDSVVAEIFQTAALTLIAYSAFPRSQNARRGTVSQAADTSSACKEDRMEPLSVTVDAAARTLGIGRTKTYQLIKTGELESFRLGARRLVTLTSLKALVARSV